MTKSILGKPGKWKWTTVTFPNAGKMLTIPIRVELGLAQQKRSKP